MVLIPRPSQAVPAVLNAWRSAVGGCICADAPNVVTSAAAIIHRVSMHRNTTQLPATQLSRVSRQASGGFMIIERVNSLPVRNYPRRIRTHQINRCPDQLDECLQTGKRCFTNRKFTIGLLCAEYSVDLGHDGGSLAQYPTPSDDSESPDLPTTVADMWIGSGRAHP